jgi:hypothetical protein
LMGRREVRSGRGEVAKAQLATTPPHGRCGCNGTWRWRVQWRESGWRDAYRCNRYVLQTPLGLGGLNVGRLLLLAHGLGNEAAGGVAALERRRPFRAWLRGVTAWGILEVRPAFSQREKEAGAVASHRGRRRRGQSGVSPREFSKEGGGGGVSQREKEAGAAASHRWRRRRGGRRLSDGEGGGGGGVSQREKEAGAVASHRGRRM